MKQDEKRMKPAQIEKRSMEIIASELAQMGIEAPGAYGAVLKRVIHTTADFDYAENLHAGADAIEKAVAALRRGTVIVTDTNMSKAGLSRPAMGKLNCAAHCFMADDDVAQRAVQCGTTRAAVSMEKAAGQYPDALFSVGNAPTALLRLCDLMEAGLRPSLVIAAPVGFVHVVESKERTVEVCERFAVPYIAAMGRKGGSNVAAAICNALLYLAVNAVDPVKRETL